MQPKPNLPSCGVSTAPCVSCPPSVQPSLTSDGHTRGQSPSRQTCQCPRLPPTHMTASRRQMPLPLPAYHPQRWSFRAVQIPHCLRSLPRDYGAYPPHALCAWVPSNGRLKSRDRVSPPEICHIGSMATHLGLPAWLKLPACLRGFPSSEGSPENFSKKKKKKKKKHGAAVE